MAKHERPLGQTVELPSGRFGELVLSLCAEHCAQLKEALRSDNAMEESNSADDSKKVSVVTNRDTFEDGLGDSLRPPKFVINLDDPLPLESEMTDACSALRTEQPIYDSATSAKCSQSNETRERLGTTDSSQTQRSAQTFPHSVSIFGAETTAYSSFRDKGNAPNSNSFSTTDLLCADFKMRPEWSKKVSRHKSAQGSAEESQTAMKHIESTGTAASREALLAEAALRCPAISHPNSKYRVCWDCFGLLSLLYDVVTIPLQTFTLPNIFFFWAMGVITLLFWTLDFISSFFVGFYLNGALITSHKRVIKRYLTSWFTLDLLIVGFDWFFFTLEPTYNPDSEGDSAQSYVRLLRALRIIRVVRLVRLLKMRRILRNIEDIMDTEKLSIYFNFMKPIAVCVTVNHFCACLWYKVGDLGMKDSFIKFYELDQRSFGYRYTTCLHWSLCQFAVGNMDINAVNTVERLFTVIVFIIGLCMFSSLLGSVASSVEQLRRLHTDETVQFWKLQRYLKERRIPSRLAVRIHRYCDYQYKQNMGRKIDDGKVPLLKLLSEQLHNELETQIKLPHITKHPLFKILVGLNDIAITKVCAKALSDLECAQQDVLFNPGDHCSRMLLLLDGTCSYHGLHTSQDGLSGRVSARLDTEMVIMREGDWACEAALWTKWVHVGILTARTEASMIEVNMQLFVDIMSTAGRRAFDTVKAYAGFFTQRLNTAVSDGCHLTDMLQHIFTPDQVLEEIRQEGSWDLRGSRSAALSSFSPMVAVGSFRVARPSIQNVDSKQSNAGMAPQSSVPWDSADSQPSE